MIGLQDKLSATYENTRKFGELSNLATMNANKKDENSAWFYRGSQLGWFVLPAVGQGVTDIFSGVEPGLQV